MKLTTLIPCLEKLSWIQTASKDADSDDKKETDADDKNINSNSDVVKQMQNEKEKLACGEAAKSNTI